MKSIPAVVAEEQMVAVRLCLGNIRIVRNDARMNACELPQTSGAPEKTEGSVYEEEPKARGQGVASTAQQANRELPRGRYCCTSNLRVERCFRLRT